MALRAYGGPCMSESTRRPSSFAYEPLSDAFTRPECEQIDRDLVAPREPCLYTESWPWSDVRSEKEPRPAA